MAGQRKRKHATLDEPQSKQTAQSKAQLGIKNFGTITKPNVADSAMKKRKTVHLRDPMTSAAAQPSMQKMDKKRKRSVGVDEEPIDRHLASNAEDAALKQLSQHNAATPQSKRFKPFQPLSPVETPSKDTTALFDKLKLGASTKAIPFPLDNKQQVYDTPPDTPPATVYEADRLPAELEDLLYLQAAFLSALSLYYAHNGTSSPVNVKALLPMITKTWRKRSVSVDDLRVLLGLGQGEAQFTLQDFGRAGICLTKPEPRGRAIKRAASFVDEVDLNAGFEEALQRRWAQWLFAVPKENHDVAVFLDQLPLAEIRKHESVELTAPLFARGQQRLADLKASQAAANAPGFLKRTEVSAEQRTGQIVQTRNISLLDRVLTKQAHAASLPSGPTKAQLERKAALHRIEEIERILDLLAAGRPRCSFSMPVVIQQLQQSLRNPISKDEVERCLGLMADEITPGFVRLVRSGTVTGVVVTKGGKVVLEQLRQRVQNAEA